MSGTGEKDLSRIREIDKKETKFSKKDASLRYIQRREPTSDQTLEQQLINLQKEHGGIFGMTKTSSEERESVSERQRQEIQWRYAIDQYIEENKKTVWEIAKKREMTFDEYSQVVKE